MGWLQRNVCPSPVHATAAARRVAKLSAAVQHRTRVSQMMRASIVNGDALVVGIICMVSARGAGVPASRLVL
jgi:hypothetical protein